MAEIQNFPLKKKRREKPLKTLERDSSWEVRSTMKHKYSYNFSRIEVWKQNWRQQTFFSLTHLSVTSEDRKPFLLLPLQRSLETLKKFLLHALLYLVEDYFIQQNCSYSPLTDTDTERSNNFLNAVLWFLIVLKQDTNWARRTSNCNKTSVFIARIWKLQRRLLLIKISPQLLHLPQDHYLLFVLGHAAYLPGSSIQATNLLCHFNKLQLRQHRWQTYVIGKHERISKPGLEDISFCCSENLWNPNCHHFHQRKYLCYYNLQCLISRRKTEPSLGLTLSKMTRNDRLLTKDNFTVP